MVSSEFLSAPDLSLFRILLMLNGDYNSPVAYFNNIPLVCVLACLGHTQLLKELAGYLNSKFTHERPDINTAEHHRHLLCVDENTTNCLCYSTQHNQLECSKYILENSIDPMAMLTKLDSNGYCAFTYAAMAKHDALALLKFYVKFVVDSNIHGLRSIGMLLEQALMLSAMHANKNCLNYLIDLCLESGVNVDGVDSLKGETALTAACLNGHRTLCEILVERGGASLVKANSKSWMPLLCAVKSGCWETVEYLLSKNGEIINQSDKHGRTALILAASEGHLAIMDILIEKGADLFAQDKDGLSALSWACLKGHYNAVLTLLDHGVDVNHSDHSGRTPLDLATFYGDVRLVSILNHYFNITQNK